MKKKYTAIYNYDIVVIGAGHAGLEAAMASARTGKKTALITINTDNICQMSCNPAIGGLAKSHIVREIDALGGFIGQLADKCAIQYRMLNLSKGLAVWSLRAQQDKYQYVEEAKKIIFNTPNLDLYQDSADALVLNAGGKSITGIVTERNIYFKTSAVILCTGTFLNGKIFIGDYTKKAGRIGELPNTTLTTSLKKANIKIGRLKTGTPARVNKNSIDFSKMKKQEDEDKGWRFSYHNIINNNQRLPCYITYTSEKTHNIIKKNIKRSPLFSGKIIGAGPRYCPSIEDKIVKFPDKDKHQLFLEPEGINTNEYYINGLSSSLPEEVQIEFIKSIPGLEQCQIIKPAYAIEYDFADPIQLKRNLESKIIKGLFFAGQINGTSGYEEAAAQGLMAGINAVKFINKKEPFILERYESYIGVLIDDLVTKGTKEPYRMFTSRAEHRLSLRFDNADLRLSEKGHELSLINKEQYNKFLKRKNNIKNFKIKFDTQKIPINIIKKEFNITSTNSTIKYLMQRPDFNFEKIFFNNPQLFLAEKKDYFEIKTVEAEIKYEGYIKKQENEIKNIIKRSKTKIPKNFDFNLLAGLKKEAIEKLKTVMPDNIEQASRIPGITPSDIQLLLYNMRQITK